MNDTQNENLAFARLLKDQMFGKSGDGFATRPAQLLRAELAGRTGAWPPSDFEQC